MVLYRILVSIITKTAKVKAIKFIVIILEINDANSFAIIVVIKSIPFDFGFKILFPFIAFRVMLVATDVIKLTIVTDMAFMVNSLKYFAFIIYFNKIAAINFKLSYCFVVNRY